MLKTVELTSDQQLAVIIGTGACALMLLAVLAFGAWIYGVI
jgi:hypothetical protein